MIKYILLVNASGKIRISKYYEYFPELNIRRLETDVIKTCLFRENTQSNVWEYEDYTIVYRRYGNLMFIAGISSEENELAVFELFQHIVETLKEYFGGSVSEMHIIYNMDKVYLILDEMIMNGVIAETSQARILAPLKLLTAPKT